jgi:hypothetical protein
MNRADSVLVEGITAIEPYLNRLVIAGGWVPYIYSKMYGSMVNRDPLITRDIDIAVSKHGFSDNVPTLNDAILFAGFKYQFASLDNPPVVKYIKEYRDAELIELEFITDAPGQQEGVVKVGSINAQSLRYVKLLMDDPWEVKLVDVGFEYDATIRIPRPSSYLLHKSLIAGRRRSKAKTAKDLYYIFYTLESFPEWKNETLVGISLYGAVQPKLVKKARGYLQRQFADIDATGVDCLVSQRPQTAFPEMNEDQFRQYSLSIMEEVITAMSTENEII